MYLPPPLHNYWQSFYYISWNSNLNKWQMYKYILVVSQKKDVEMTDEMKV